MYSQFQNHQQYTRAVHRSWFCHVAARARNWWALRLFCLSFVIAKVQVGCQMQTLPGVTGFAHPVYVCVWVCVLLHSYIYVCTCYLCSLSVLHPTKNTIYVLLSDFGNEQGESNERSKLVWCATKVMLHVCTYAVLYEDFVSPVKAEYIFNHVRVEHAHDLSRVAWAKSFDFL